MATFKLELNTNEAAALRQIIDAGNIPNKMARVVASIQNKFDAAAKTYGAELQKESSPPELSDEESPPRPKDGEGGEGPDATPA